MQCTSCGMIVQPGEAKCNSCGTPVPSNTSDFSSYLEDDAIPYIPYENSSLATSLSYISQQKQTEQPILHHSPQSLPGANLQSKPARQEAPRQQRPMYMAALLIELVLLIIIGSGTIYYAAALHPAELNAHATAVAQNVFATQTNATATAHANSPQSIYNQITRKNPLFVDPLDGQHSSIWGKHNQGDASCAFANGAYHIYLSAKEYYYDCLASGSEYGDFVYQVQATIIKGFYAGIIFRSNNLGTSAYFFGFSYSGLYSLNMAEGPQRGSVLAFGRSSAIRIGLNQPNLLSVLVRGSNIDLFINKQFIKGLQDETYEIGTIGLLANNTMHSPTDVAFSNAQVWNLP